jgi:ankyrin repeat protein
MADDESALLDAIKVVNHVEALRIINEVVDRGGDAANLFHFINGKEKPPVLDGVTIYDTPLHLAIKNRMEGVALRLIELDADFSCKCFHGRIPLAGMGERGDTALTLACQRGLAQVALALIKKGVDVNMIGQFLKPIHYAIKNELNEVIAAMVSHGLNMDLNQCLRYACEQEKENVATMLIGMGAVMDDEDANNP